MGPGTASCTSTSSRCANPCPASSSVGRLSAIRQVSLPAAAALPNAALRVAPVVSALAGGASLHCLRSAPALQGCNPGRSNSMAGPTAAALAASIKAELKPCDYKRDMLNVGMAPSDHFLVINQSVLRGAVKYCPQGVLRACVIQEAFALLDQDPAACHEFWRPP